MNDSIQGDAQYSPEPKRDYQTYKAYQKVEPLVGHIKISSHYSLVTNADYLHLQQQENHLKNALRWNHQGYLWTRWKKKQTSQIY